MDEPTLRYRNETVRSSGRDSHGQVHSVSLACNVGEIENVTDRRGRIRDKDRPKNIYVSSIPPAPLSAKWFIDMPRLKDTATKSAPA